MLLVLVLVLPPVVQALVTVLDKGRGRSHMIRPPLKLVYSNNR